MAGGKACPLQLLLVIIFVVAGPVMAAPYLKTATGDARLSQKKQPPLDHLFKPSQGLIGPLFRHNDYSMHPPALGGCYYQFRHYDEGDRIITNEPCLNCTCHNSMLMCYLKVCPFSKPIGQDCTVEKSPDQCCPVITCPQVPVNLQVMHMPFTTTSLPAPSSSSTGLVTYTHHGCTIGGQYYSDGAQVPGNPSKPCELCYCIRNHTTCLMQECVLKVQGCEPVFEEGICCPVRYSCDHEDYEGEIITTTIGPNGTLITTTIQPPPYASGCMHNNDFYADGIVIPSEDPCEHCYCMKTDIICAIQECASPLAEEAENCKPRAPPPGQCCPEAYDCPDAPISAITTLKDQEIEPESPTKAPDVEVVSTDVSPAVTTTEDLVSTEYPESVPLETRTTLPDTDIELTTSKIVDIATDKLTTIDKLYLEEDFTTRSPKPDILEEETDADVTTKIPAPDTLVPETTELYISEPETKIDETTKKYTSAITEAEKHVVIKITTPGVLEPETEVYVTTKTPLLDDVEPEISIITKPDIMELETEVDTTPKYEKDITTKKPIADIVDLEVDKDVTTIPSDIIEPETSESPSVDILEPEFETEAITKKPTTPTMLERETVKEIITEIPIPDDTLETEYKKEATTKTPTTDILDRKTEITATIKVPTTDILKPETVPEVVETTRTPTLDIFEPETEKDVSTKTSPSYTLEPETSTAKIRPEIYIDATTAIPTEDAFERETERPLVDIRETEKYATTMMSTGPEEPETEVYVTIKTPISDISETETEKDVSTPTPDILKPESEIDISFKTSTTKIEPEIVDKTTKVPTPDIFEQETEKPYVQILDDQFPEEEIPDYIADSISTSHPTEFVTKSSDIPYKLNLTTDYITDPFLTTHLVDLVTKSSLIPDEAEADVTTDEKVLIDVTKSPFDITSKIPEDFDIAKTSPFPDEVFDEIDGTTPDTVAEDEIITEKPYTTAIPFIPKEPSNETYPSAPMEPEEYYTTHKPEDFVTESKEPDHLHEIILPELDFSEDFVTTEKIATDVTEDEDKEILAHPTTISSVRETDQTTVQIPIIVEYPEHKPPVSKPEILDQTILEVVEDDTADVISTTRFAEPITESSVRPVTDEKPDGITDKTPAISLVTEVKETVPTEVATISYEDHTPQKTTYDTKISVTSTSAMLSAEDEKDVTTTSLVTDAEDITYRPVVDDDTITERIEHTIEETTTSVLEEPIDEAFPSIPKEPTKEVTEDLEIDFISPSKAPEITEEITTELESPYVVTEDVETTVRDATDRPVEEKEKDEPYVTTTRSTVDKHILEETTKSPMLALVDTEKLNATYIPPSEIMDVEDYDYAYDPLSTTKVVELSTPSSFISDTSDSTTADIEQVDVTEKTYDFTTKTKDISIVDERVTDDKITTIIYDKITTVSPVDDRKETLIQEDKLLTAAVTDDISSTTPVMDISYVPTGEGLCTSDGKVYEHGKKVPAPSKCQECKCNNSFITCTAIRCPPPPPAFLRCDIRQTSEECCPLYDCPLTIPSVEDQLADPEVTTQPEEEIDITEDTLLDKEDVSIELTTLSAISEKEAVTDKTLATLVYPEYKPSVSEPEILDQTIQEITEDDTTDKVAPDDQYTTDLLQTTHFVEPITKSSVIIDTFDTTVDEKPIYITEKTPITEPVTEVEEKVTTEAAFTSFEDDIVDMTTKLVDTKLRTTSPTPYEEMKDEIDATTSSPVTEHDEIDQKPGIDYETVTEDIERATYETTTTYADKPIDKPTVAVPKESTEYPTVEETTLEPEGDYTTSSKKPDYIETSSVAPEIEVDTTTYSELHEPVLVTETFEDDITEESIPSDTVTEKEVETEETFPVEKDKLSTLRPDSITIDSFFTSQPMTDVSFTTKGPETTAKTSVKIADVTPAEEEKEPELSKTPDAQLVTTEMTTRDDDVERVTHVTEKDTVDEVTTQATVKDYEDIEIHLPDIFGTESPDITRDTQPDVEVTEIQEDKDKIVTTMKSPVTISKEVTRPVSDKVTAADYTTKPDLLPDVPSTTPKTEDKQVHTKYPTESTSVPELSTSYLLPEISRPSDSKTTAADEVFPSITESQLVPQKEVTKLPDETVTTGAPGEGLCTSDGKVYFNGEKVPVSSPCQEECRCSNSVITCKAVKCPPPPPAFLRCDVRQTSKECCPFYECPLVFPGEIESDSAIEPPKPTEDSKTPEPSTEKITEKPHADDPDMPVYTEIYESVETYTILPVDLETKLPVITDKTMVYTDSSFVKVNDTTLPLESVVAETKLPEEIGTFLPTEEVETSTLSLDIKTTEKPIERVTSTSLETIVDLSTDIPPEIDHDVPEDVSTKEPVETDVEKSTTQRPETIADEEVALETLTKSTIDFEEPVTTYKPEVNITALPEEMPSDKEEIFEDCLFDTYTYKHGELTTYKDNCRDNCKCNNGTFECEQKACSSPPPISIGVHCEVSQRNDSCCPVYECLPMTGRTCFHHGMVYMEGWQVPSLERCTNCYCIGGEVKCTDVKCGIPQENCRPVVHDENECCPSLYICSESTFPLFSTSTETPDVKTTAVEGIDTTPKEVISELFTTVTATTEVLNVTKEKITEIILNLTTTQLPPTEEISVSQVIPEETVPEDGDQEVEPPFPPFPGVEDQSYLVPHVTTTTTKKPTAAAEVILGPGSCLFDGKIYVSAQQIPRDNPCDFCFCFRGDIICLQQSCPPPIPGCYEEAIAGFCCPRYECPVRKAVMNITTTTPSPFPGFPPTTKTSRINMCEIDGKHYASGAKVTSASTPCLDCRCGDDGFMKCSPMECPSSKKAYQYKKHGYR